MARPKRAAMRGATARPMRVDPVALTSRTRRSSTSASPISASPTMTAEIPCGASGSPAITRSSSAWHASAVSGVFSDGFQTMLLPQTSARAAFHAQTATGKLKALIMPTTPSGCHISIIR